MSRDRAAAPALRARERLATHDSRTTRAAGQREVETPPASACAVKAPARGEGKAGCCAGVANTANTAEGGRIQRNTVEYSGMRVLSSAGWETRIRVPLLGSSAPSAITISVT